MNDPVVGVTISQIAIDRAQQMLDAFARSRGYDDIKALVTYDGDADVTFAAEGARGKLLRSQMWATLRTIQTQVLTGARPIPNSFDELLAELPALTWS